jgi:hypothetical protein
MSAPDDAPKRRYRKPEGWQPELRFPEDYPSKTKKGQARCLSWNPNTGKQCSQVPMLGDGHPIKGYRTTCRSHRGKAARGIAHYNFQGKGRGKYMPPQLLPLYQAALSGELLDLTDSVATLETRSRQLLQSMTDQGDPTLLLTEVKAAWEELWRATRAKDDRAMAVARQRIDDALAKGAATAAVWDQVLETEEQLRKTVETETGRRVKMRDVLSMEDAIVNYRMLTQAVRDVLTAGEGLPREAKEALSPDVRAALLRAIADRFAGIAGVADLPRSATS